MVPDAATLREGALPFGLGAYSRTAVETADFDTSSWPAAYMADIARWR